MLPNYLVLSIQFWVQKMNSFYKYGRQNFLKPLGLQCGDQRREENLLIQQLDGIQHSLKPLQFLKQVLMLESFIIYTFG